MHMRSIKMTTRDCTDTLKKLHVVPSTPLQYVHSVERRMDVRHGKLSMHNLLAKINGSKQ